MRRSLPIEFDLALEPRRVFRAPCAARHAAAQAAGALLEILEFGVCDGGTISLGQDLVAPAQALRRRGDRPERQDSPDLIEALTA